MSSSSDQAYIQNLQKKYQKNISEGNKICDSVFKELNRELTKRVSLESKIETLQKKLKKFEYEISTRDEKIKCQETELIALKNDFQRLINQYQGFDALMKQISSRSTIPSETSSDHSESHKRTNLDDDSNNEDRPEDRQTKRLKGCDRTIRRLNTVHIHAPGTDEADKSDKLVLDFDRNTRKELLAVDANLSACLKTYQREGVQYMWDKCFSSIETLKGSNGGGCILAHCMGLGKTLQVIALIHTLLSNQSQTNVKKVLIICPVNVIYNWRNEFDIWLKKCNRNKDINIHELFTCRSNNRNDRIRLWHQEGGVLLIGYDMFRRLQESGSKESVISAGPDLLVCDEGHILKNPRLSKAMNKVSTLRRIVLTDKLLENNLIEYVCMVEFVNPGLLDTVFYRQYSNINCTDLRTLIDGCVQWRDYSILAQLVPPKHEYLLFIRLTDVQIALYKFYMTNFKTCGPMVNFPKLRKICNHPKVLQMRRKESTYENVSESDTNIESGNDSQSDTEHSEATTLPNDGIDKREWWTSLCNENKLNAIESSSKMDALFTIINKCEELGDKLLVFSSCLSTLNVIEHFLSEVHKQKDSASSHQFKGSWKRDIDYIRLDGTRSIEARNRDISNFNSKNNLRARLFLISTKAGGIGINLMAANRVVIFDASWKPSNDIQSIFCAFRVGQTKEVFVYRFISVGTMEEKIYDRQITSRHNEENDVHYRNFASEPFEKAIKSNTDYAVSPLYEEPVIGANFYIKSDPDAECILNELFCKHSDVCRYRDHDSLENKIEGLTNDEMKEYWSNELRL